MKLTLREQWRLDRTLIGGWCHVPNSFTAELMGRSGYDWVCIDTQHGLAGQDVLVQMIQALQITETPAFVRVPWNTPDLLMRALDCGADGVIVPMVSDAEQARNAVRACRYAPDGYRSWGPTRASLAHDDYSPHTANESVVCVVMIETREAMHNLDSILEVAGVDGIYIGPSDLAVAHGIAPTGDPTDATHIALIDTILRSCQSHGVIAGIHCDSVESAIRWRDMGFRMLNVGSDAKFVRNGATTVVRALRETT